MIAFTADIASVNYGKNCSSKRYICSNQAWSRL